MSAFFFIIIFYLKYVIIIYRFAKVRRLNRAYLLKLTSMLLVSIFLCKFDIEIYYSHTVLFCDTATYCMYNYVNLWFERLPGGGGGGTPLYGLDSYVRRQRVWFFGCFGHK